MKYFNDKFWDYSKNIWLQQADESGEGQVPKKGPRKTEGGNLYETDLVKKRMGGKVDRTLKGDKPAAPESSDLEARMAALETLVTEQAETIKGLEERVAELEGKEIPEKKPIIEVPEIGENKESYETKEKRLAKKASARAGRYAKTAKQLAKQHPTSEAKKLKDEAIEAAKTSAEVAEDAQIQTGPVLISFRERAERHEQTAKEKSEAIQKLIDGAKDTAVTKTSDGEGDIQADEIVVDSSAVKKGTEETVIVEEMTPLGEEQRLAQEAATRAKKASDEASELMKTGSRPVLRLALKARSASKKADFAADEAKKVDSEERAKFFRQHAELEAENAIKFAEQAMAINAPKNTKPKSAKQTKVYEGAREKEEEVRKIRKILKIKISNEAGLTEEKLTDEQQQLLNGVNLSKLAMLEESIQRELEPKSLENDRKEVPDERKPIVEEIQSREDAERKLAEIQGDEYTPPDPDLPTKPDLPISTNIPLKVEKNRDLEPDSESLDKRKSKLKQAENATDSALTNAYKVSMRTEILGTANSRKVAKKTFKIAEKINSLYLNAKTEEDIIKFNELTTEIETLSQKIHHLALPTTARAKKADKETTTTMNETYKNKDTLKSMLYEWIKEPDANAHYTASERGKDKEWINQLDLWDQAHPDDAEVQYKGKKSPEKVEPQEQEVAVEENTALLAKRAEVDESNTLARRKRAEADAASGELRRAKGKLSEKDTRQRQKKIERAESKFTGLDSEAKQLEEIAALHQKELDDLEQGTETPDEE